MVYYLSQGSESRLHIHDLRSLAERFGDQTTFYGPVWDVVNGYNGIAYTNLELGITHGYVVVCGHKFVQLMTRLKF